VIDLEPAALLAAPPVGSDVRALPAVALEDLALDRVGHLAAPRGSLDGGGRLAGLASDPEALLLHVGDEQREGTVDDLGEVARRKLVAQQILRLADLVPLRARSRVPDLVRLGGQRRDDRASWPLRRDPRRARRWCRRRRRGEQRLGGGRRFGRALDRRLADRVRHRRPRMATREQLLDLAPRLARRLLEQLVCALGREPTAQHPQTAQVDPPGPQ